MRHDIDVAVVGAGAAGLGVALALQHAGRSVEVFESADAVGGRMRTDRADGFITDTGAEMLGTHGYDATWRLIHEVGLTPAEIPRVPNPVALWRHGRAHADVGRPRGLLTGAGLSVGARLQMVRHNAWATAHARKFDGDHPEATPLGTTTLAQHAARYGDEVAQSVFDPLAACFFGWDPQRNTAAPMVSLLLATRSTATWCTYRDGMDTLTRRLAQRVNVSANAAVRQVVATDDGVRLEIDDRSIRARTAVLCVPAPVALGLHPGMPDDEQPYLRAATFAPMLRVSCRLTRPLSFAGAESAYVLLFSGSAAQPLSGITLEHHKAAGRAPKGRGLASLLSHPRHTPELLQASDAEIIDQLCPAAEQYLPGLAAATTDHTVHRFRDGLPEATPAALRLRAAFLRRPSRAIDYAGDWLMLRPASEAAFRSAELTAARVTSRSVVPRVVTAANH